MSWMIHKDQKYSVTAPQQDDRFLKLDDVMARLGVSRSTIWRLTQSGDFPRSIAISRGRKGWLKSHVDAWIADRLRSEEEIVAQEAGDELATRGQR
jgi:prophage regulatory protein